eukprot:CAMPEP_0116125812 /NCGR_PEP_ID=MMETSP0329-20121206/6005_1 /TAXON_ID=697910 /ORGANISM="Pseudo-nitzschia arenysensis, Strain B593" /LENGTH=352 /DNA_ID=CAMNT_0003619867 /DNA_START=184 /DNA_END=1242 /DNA_ORIENTATION=-
MSVFPKNNRKPVRSKPSILWCFLTFLLGYIAGVQNPMCDVVNNKTLEVRTESMEMLATPKAKKRPLQIFPLLKDLSCGWSKNQIPPLLKKNAKGQRSLVVDIGLDDGAEFFKSIGNGFEAVGMEPNPEQFPKLKKKCDKYPTCNIIDLQTAELPLKREPGQSYLINAGAGSTKGIVKFASQGPVSTIVADEALNEKQTITEVPVVRVDSIIDEDIYLFKIDTQGYDQYVLEGASKIFENHVVRQVIAEVDPFNLSRNNHSPRTILEYLQDVGMACFHTRTDQLKMCRYYGESIDGLVERFPIDQTGPNRPYSKCWEDFICVNVEKEFTGSHPPNKPKPPKNSNRKLTKILER